MLHLQESIVHVTYIDTIRHQQHQSTEKAVGIQYVCVDTIRSQTGRSKVLGVWIVVIQFSAGDIS